MPQPSKPKANKSERDSKAGVDEDSSAKDVLRLDQEKRERRSAIVKETKKKLAAQKLARAEMQASLAAKQEKVEQLEAPLKAERAASAAAATKLQTRVRMQSAQKEVQHRREAREHLQKKSEAATKLQTRARMQFASKEVALKQQSRNGDGRAQPHTTEQTARTEDAGQFTRMSVEEDMKMFGEALQNEIANTSMEGRAVNTASGNDPVKDNTSPQVTLRSKSFQGTVGSRSMSSIRLLLFCSCSLSHVNIRKSAESLHQALLIVKSNSVSFGCDRFKVATITPRSALKKKAHAEVVAGDVDAETPATPLNSGSEAQQRLARAEALTPAAVEAELSKAKATKEAMEEVFDEDILNKANAAARAQKLENKPNTALGAVGSPEGANSESAASAGAYGSAHETAALGSDQAGPSKLTWAQKSTLVVELGWGAQAHWAQVDAERFEARAAAKEAADAALQEAADALAAEEAKANAAEHQMEAIMAQIAALEAEGAVKTASNDPDSLAAPPPVDASVADDASAVAADDASAVDDAPAVAADDADPSSITNDASAVPPGSVNAEVKTRPSVARPETSPRAKRLQDADPVPIKDEAQTKRPPPPSLARPTVAKRVPGDSR